METKKDISGERVANWTFKLHFFLSLIKENLSFNFCLIFIFHQSDIGFPWSLFKMLSFTWFNSYQLLRSLIINIGRYLCCFVVFNFKRNNALIDSASLRISENFSVLSFFNFIFNLKFYFVDIYIDLLVFSVASLSIYIHFFFYSFFLLSHSLYSFLFSFWFRTWIKKKEKKNTY